MVRLNPVLPIVLRVGDRICATDSLVDGGLGVRFQIEVGGSVVPAFAVRHAGRVSAFLNRCAHRGVELDWQEGNFFDSEQRFLVCATHDARYDPSNGACVSGPCRGAKLSSVTVRETEGWIWLVGAGGND